MAPANLPAIAGLETVPIPCAPGHDVVYGLAGGSGNEIYLAASNEFTPGLCAQVFAFDYVKQQFRLVIDLQRDTGFDPGSGLMPHSKIHLALQSTSTGRAFAATHFTAPAVGQTSFDPMAAYREKYPGCFLLEYDPRRDRVLNHGLLVRGEGARIACLDERHHQFYFLSYPRNHLYRYDYRRRTLHDLGRIGQENAFGLEVDDDGNVYTSDDRGRFVRYSLRRDCLEELPLFVPLAPGRRAAGNYIRRMVRGIDGSFYGFGNKGMRLFRLAAGGTGVADHGVVCGSDDDVGHRRPHLPPAKAVVQIDRRTLLIAMGGDGIYADESPVPNLIRYDLLRRRAIDAGKFIAPEDGSPAWIPQCALFVPRARAVFLGLQQTAGPLRLWKVNVGRPAPPRRQPVRPAYREHVARVRAQPFGASVEGTSDLPYVRHGHVQLHELGWAGEDLVIPPGETAIAALYFDRGYALYGLTRGARPHLFTFAPYVRNRFTENYDVHVWDLGVIRRQPVQAGKLLPDPKRGRLLVALKTARSTVVVSYPPGVERSRYRAVYHSVPAAPPVAWAANPFEDPLELSHREISFENLTCLPAADGLVSTTPDGSLVAIDWNGNVQPLDIPAAILPSGLTTVGTDRVFAVTRQADGWLLPANLADAPEPLAMFRELAVSPTTFATDAAGGQLAIGGLDGRVEILNLAQPCERLTVHLRYRWNVRALAWHRNGLLYGFYGADDGIGEAFSLDPQTGAVREIGILQVAGEPRYWMCHRCDAIVAGARGELYFGEADRIAHLFSFVDEPVARRDRSAEAPQ